MQHMRLFSVPLLAAGIGLATLASGATAQTAGSAQTADDQPAAPAGTSATPAAKPDGSRRVCRSVMLTGSRFSKRFCKSAADWERDRDAASRLVREGQADGYRRDGEMNGQGMAGPPR